MGLACGGGLVAQVPYDPGKGLPEVRTRGLDLNEVMQEDAERERNGELALYGRIIPVSSDLLHEGAWSEEDGEQVWRMRIVSPGAEATELFLPVFLPGRHGRLIILDPEGVPRHGPYTMEDDPSGHGLSTPLVAGEACVLEFRTTDPDGASVLVGGVGHAYRDVEAMVCNVDVACTPEGTGWQDAIAGTVRISIVQNAGTGWCSGALVNNVRQDCKPYILTAWHCGAGSTTAQFNQYKFYFGYARPQCGSGSAPAGMVLTGAQLRGYSNDDEGRTGSDFMLLEMNAQVPSSFNAFWSGWDATQSSTSAGGGVSVHHPLGQPKKISTYTQTLTTGHWSNQALASHWLVRWAATANGHGVTASGSSGGPLFKRDNDGRAYVIGTLSGSSGGLSCTNTGGTSFFGKVSYHWSGNPNFLNQKLRHWLDPDGTGTLVLPGSADPCGSLTNVLERVAERPRVQPNPADQWTTVQWDGMLEGTGTLLVTDMAGRTVQGPLMVRSSMFELETGGMLPGTYHVRLVRNDGRVVVTPLVVVHP